LEKTDIFEPMGPKAVEERLRRAGEYDVLSGIQKPRSRLLGRFVDDVRVHRPVAGRARRVELLPDGTMSLMFRVLEDGRRGDVSIIGPRTRALFKTATPVPLCIVVQLAPGAGGPLLGLPASDLTNRYVLLEDIWGPKGASVRQRLLAARSVTQVLEELERILLIRQKHVLESASSRLARRAVDLWRQDHDIDVAHVAGQLGVTARHLRRAFDESVGVRPKEFARMLRLQQAVRAARGSTDWARIALEAGYYDQAHLIAEFRDLLGVTPGEFVPHRRPRDPLFARECPPP